MIFDFKDIGRSKRAYPNKEGRGFGPVLLHLKLLTLKGFRVPQDAKGGARLTVLAEVGAPEGGGRLFISAVAHTGKDQNDHGDNIR